MSGFHQFQNVYGRSPPSSNPGFSSGDFMQNQDSISNQLLLSKEIFLLVKKIQFSLF